MSTLLEIKSEEEWNKHSGSLPPNTLQIIYFKAEWAAPVCLSYYASILTISQGL